MTPLSLTPAACLPTDAGRALLIARMWQPDVGR